MGIGRSLWLAVGLVLAWAAPAWAEDQQPSPAPPPAAKPAPPRPSVQQQMRDLRAPGAAKMLPRQAGEKAPAQGQVLKPPAGLPMKEQPAQPAPAGEAR